MTARRVSGGDVLVDGRLERLDLVLEHGTISAIETPAGVADIDATGMIVSPGFVDVQINGGFGLDLVDDPAAMWELGRQLPSTGVTSFLPTIITSAPDVPHAAIAALRDRPSDHVGAEPIGLHFEGPMLSPERPGAHPVAHLVPAGKPVIDGWSADNGVAMVTIAPELSGAIEVIEELGARGVIVAAGHTQADGSQARAARAAGVTAVTHLFNAMAPLNHRDPNLVGVALADSALIAGLIVDGVHVDPTVVKAAWNAKGQHGIALVTDAVAAMQQPAGTYEFAGREIISDETGVRYADGTLAGSALTMDAAVRLLIDFTGCETPHALTSATRTPTDLLGDQTRGRIEVDARADLVLLDKNLHVAATISGGQLAYVSDHASQRISDHLRRTEPAWKS